MVLDSLFSNNAGSDGGAITMWNSSLLVNGTAFTNNSAGGTGAQPLRPPSLHGLQPNSQFPVNKITFPFTCTPDWQHIGVLRLSASDQTGQETDVM